MYKSEEQTAIQEQEQHPVAVSFQQEREEQASALLEVMANTLQQIGERITLEKLQGGMKHPPASLPAPEQKRAWLEGHLAGQKDLAADIGEILQVFRSKLRPRRQGKEEEQRV